MFVARDTPMLNDPYCELDDLKARIAITDAGDDAALTACILAASRQIDGLTNRVFYQLPATTRTYTAECGDELTVDDLVSATTLKTDTNGDRTYGTTWLTTDYDLIPDNAAANNMPYTRIVLSPKSTQWFPTFRRGVQITGTWGWPAVPDAIAEACLILAQRLFKRPDAPLGVLAATTPDGLGIPLRGNDPDVEALIAPYRRFALLAV